MGNTSRNIETCAWLVGRKRYNCTGTNSNARKICKSDSLSQTQTVTSTRPRYSIQLIVEQLVFPPQKGDDVSCEATDELKVFEWLMQKQSSGKEESESDILVTLGWIHSHPRHRCFLSAVDLHQQCGFQLQEPCSVAIVYSALEQDSNTNCGFFRLSPYGVGLIKRCKLRGFHPHSNAKQSLYVDCSPSIVCDRRRKTEIVDLRD